MSLIVDGRHLEHVLSHLVCASDRLPDMLPHGSSCAGCRGAKAIASCLICHTVMPSPNGMPQVFPEFAKRGWECSEHNRCFGCMRVSTCISMAQGKLPRSHATVGSDGHAPPGRGRSTREWERGESKMCTRLTPDHFCFWPDGPRRVGGGCGGRGSAWRVDVRGGEGLRPEGQVVWT